MTRTQAEKQAKEKYIELWGEEWVKRNANHIAPSYGNVTDSMYEISIDEWTPRPMEYYPSGVPKIQMGGDSKPNHRTVFLFNLTTGTMEVTEHF